MQMMRTIPWHRAKRNTAVLTSLAGLTLLGAVPLFAQEVPGGEVLAGPIYLMFATLVFSYVYLALALQTIARKTSTANGWWAWIPILQIVLSLKVARKPIWWIVLFLIPILNIVMIVLVSMGIAEARNKPRWVVRALIPLVNIVIIVLTLTATVEVREKPGWWIFSIIIPILYLIIPSYLAWSK